MGISNSSFDVWRSTKDIEEADELEKELEEEDNKHAAYKEEFYKKHYSAIHIHKEMVIQRNVSKHFQIQLPISYVHNYPVDVYLSFTNTGTGMNSLREEFYHVSVHIHAKHQAQKLLYSKHLSYFGYGDKLCFSEPNDYSQYTSILNRINFYLESIADLIKLLKQDTYGEVFTTDLVPPIDNSGGRIPNMDSSCGTLDPIYVCTRCNGQTKNECISRDSDGNNIRICFFCRTTCS